MKDEIYLVVAKGGVSRMTKRVPELEPGNVGVKVLIEIPDTVFGNNFPAVSIKLSEQEVKLPAPTVKAVGEGW